MAYEESIVCGCGNSTVSLTCGRSDTYTPIVDLHHDHTGANVLRTTGCRRCCLVDPGSSCTPVRAMTLGTLPPLTIALADIPLFVIASALAAVGYRWAAYVIAP